MTDAGTIERLCLMLSEAAEIIAKQVQLLEMHGIRTDNGRLEKESAELLRSIREET